MQFSPLAIAIVFILSSFAMSACLGLRMEAMRAKNLPMPRNKLFCNLGSLPSQWN